MKEKKLKHIEQKLSLFSSNVHMLLQLDIAEVT